MVSDDFSLCRWGQYVAKYRIRPIGEAQLAEKDHIFGKDDPAGPHALRDHTVQHCRSNATSYAFEVQLLQNLAEQPVEDSRVVWPEDRYPFQQVATLTFPPQEALSEGKVHKWTRELVLSPHLTLEAHAPLGNMGRLRQRVYAASGKFRRAQNGVKAKFINDINEIPA